MYELIYEEISYLIFLNEYYYNCILAYNISILTSVFNKYWFLSFIIIFLCFFLSQNLFISAFIFILLIKHSNKNVRDMLNVSSTNNIFKICI